MLIENTNNFRVIVDAEQSYIQRAIYSISEQYQTRYNKDQAYVIPTLQNYLKIAPDRIRYELELAKRNNLVFCMKFVRGAYLVEERKVASESGKQCPVVDSFDETTSNYLNNVLISRKSAELRPGSMFLIGTHNKETLEKVIGMMQATPNKNVTVEYAQLLGLADHITMQLRRQGHPVKKYLPYGPTSTMVPYLIRRAQQLSQMNYPLVLQYDLMKHELRTRLGLES